MAATVVKVALVTGVSPGGIGVETAKGLAAAGYTVTLASRNETKAREAADEIERDPRVRDGGGRTEIMRLDLNDLRDVSRFAAEFQATHTRLDVLVCNAGLNTMGDPPDARTANGFERCWGVNYLSHFHLVSQLTPLLVSSAPSRVVNVSSQMHRGGEVDFETAGYTPTSKSYSTSKLAQVLHAYELQRRMKDLGVDVRCFAVTPGAVRSNIWRTLPWAVQLPAKALFSLLFLSTEQGASTSIRAATDPDLTGGQYLSPYKGVGTCPSLFAYVSLYKGPTVYRSSPASYSVDAARRLWAVSERMIQEALAVPAPMASEEAKVAEVPGTGAGGGAAGSGGGGPSER